ncbi:MAG TPA: alpha/beta fold hydrolase [Roseiarcus sp.]|jgi:pimeloyl-ACP methyl ester carboxylesterase
MPIRLLGIAALVLVAAFGALVAFVRYGLRPRRARLDPTLTELPVETVTIASLSGAALAGWFVRGDGDGGVLLLHGAKSNRSAHVERMRTLRREGYSTLAIDFQAHGESTGDCITLGQREALDARSALEWMRARMPGEQLAALGVSMGAAAALIGGPIQADALIIESAFADLAPSLSTRLSRTIGEAARPATPLLLLALRVAAGIDHRRMRPVEAIGRFSAPILVLHGAEDLKTTTTESQALFARANPPKFYWEAPGAGHIDLAYAGGEAYWERLLGFLASTLRAPGVRGENCGSIAEDPI